MKLQQLAHALGATLVGDNGDVEIRGIATLNEAEADQVSFLTNPAYTKAAASTSAAAVLAPRGQVPPESLHGGASLLEHDAPYLALAEALELFHPARTMPQGSTKLQSLISMRMSIRRQLSVLMSLSRKALKSGRTLNLRRV